MGTPGHMAHPFDLKGVETGEDLIKFFEFVGDKLVDEISNASVKIDNSSADGRSKY